MSCNTKFDLSKIKQLVYTAKLQGIIPWETQLFVHVLVSLGTSRTHMYTSVFLTQL